MFRCSTWLRLLLLCRGPTFPSTLRCLPQLSQWRWVSGWLQIHSLVQLIRWALLIENVEISRLGSKSAHNFLSAIYFSFTRPDSSLERVFKFILVWVPNAALRPFLEEVKRFFFVCEGTSCNYDIISFQGVVTEASPQSVPPSSQDASGQQQPLGMDNTSDHAPTYTFQPAKWVWETLLIDKTNGDNVSCFHMHDSASTQRFYNIAFWLQLGEMLQCNILKRKHMNK